MGTLSIVEFADKINEIIPVLMKGFAKQQFSELYKVKLTFPQFIILQFLSKENESKMTELARFMNVTTAAMTGIVERLVQSRYALRVFDPHDRRIIKIKLTAQGHDIVNKINKYRREMIIRVFGQISGNDRESYLNILTKIRDVLLQEDSQAK